MRPSPTQSHPVSRAKRRLKRIVRRVVSRDRPDLELPGHPDRDIWSVGIFTGRTPFELKSPLRFRNPVLTGRDVTDVTAIYIADPFLFRDGKRWCLFFEILNAESGLGDIGVATSTNLRQWDYRRVVLTEPFHLSYPYVFEWDGERYMIPESYQAGAVRLYRAVDFPDRWELDTILIDGVELVDSSLFRYQDTWYMFAGYGTPPDRSDGLRLFMADDLRGPWREHPSSPISEGDSVNSRPAGRVVEYDGHIHRFAQQSGPHYGMAVRAFRIEELSHNAYRETRVNDGDPFLKGVGEGWNAKGMHHIDAVQVAADSWVASVDGWRWGREAK